MQSTYRPIYLCTLCLLFFISSLQAQRGMIVLPRNLADLSSSANTVVVCRVLSAHVEPHPVYKNLSSVVVTVQVSDTWKGVPKKTFSYRQFLWDPRDRAEGGGYRVGDQLLLFLNPTSSAGFTSPVGMDQGRFRITRDKTGSLVASNGAGTLLRHGLSENAASAKLTSRAATHLLNPPSSTDAIPLDVLKESVRVYAQQGAAKQ